MTVSIYRPEYNADTKRYEDVNPIPRYKQGFRYRCMCHAQTILTKSSDFTQHFKTKMHQDYIVHYERNTKDLTEAHERIKYFQIKLELQHQTIRRLEQELYLLKKPQTPQTPERHQSPERPKESPSYEASLFNPMDMD